MVWLPTWANGGVALILVYRLEWCVVPHAVVCFTTSLARASAAILLLVLLYN